MSWDLRPPEVRFWEKVDKTANPPCWTWTGSVACRGYGRLGVNGREMKAHRYAYELLVGPIPEGLHIDHLCRNPACVNPAHLEPVTLAENTRRGNAPTIVASRLNVCLNGHPLTGSNVLWKPDGRRSCRTCKNTNERLRWAAMRAAPASEMG